MSLREAGLVAFRATSNRPGDSGGSTGLGRKASEESTQSPTEDEMVAAQKEREVKSFFKKYSVVFNDFVNVKIF